MQRQMKAAAAYLHNEWREKLFEQSPLPWLVIGEQHSSVLGRHWPPLARYVRRAEGRRMLTDARHHDGHLLSICLALEQAAKQGWSDDLTQLLIVLHIVARPHV